MCIHTIYIHLQYTSFSKHFQSGLILLERFQSWKFTPRNNSLLKVGPAQQRRDAVCGSFWFFRGVPCAIFPLAIPLEGCKTTTWDSVVEIGLIRYSSNFPCETSLVFWLDWMVFWPGSLASLSVDVCRCWEPCPTTWSFSGPRPFESCRLVHGKHSIPLIPLKMNDDHMRLMLWGVQLVMFGLIDASPTTVVSARLMWWFRRIFMNPSILDLLRWSHRGCSCYSVLKAMNQLFTCSLAVTDVVIAARLQSTAQIAQSLNSTVFWDKKIKKRFGTMLCFGHFCWFSADFPTTRLNFLKITSSPRRIGTGGVAAHALIADCKAVPQKKTNYGLFWCRKWSGLYLLLASEFATHMFLRCWSVLLSTMPFQEVSIVMGVPPNHPFIDGCSTLTRPWPGASPPFWKPPFQAFSASVLTRLGPGSGQSFPSSVSESNCWQNSCRHGLARSDKKRLRRSWESWESSMAYKMDGF